MAYIQLEKLQVADQLYHFVNHQVLPGLELDEPTFWANFESILLANSEKNKTLLSKRDQLQFNV